MERAIQIITDGERLPTSFLAKVVFTSAVLCLERARPAVILPLPFPPPVARRCPFLRNSSSRSRILEDAHAERRGAEASAGMGAEKGRAQLLLAHSD